MFNFQDDHEDVKFYVEENSTVEQQMMRMAIEALTPEQKEIYEWWAYDRFTFDEIGEKLGTDHSSALRRVQTIQNKIKKWVKLNKGAYILMKLEKRIQDNGNK